jgi:glycine amidinotransferase
VLETQQVSVLKRPVELAAEPIASPVCSYNEWDPLEEVIVGDLHGASVPEWHIALDATMPESSRDTFQRNAGKEFHREHVDCAKQELDGLAKALEDLGICVKRPTPVNHCRPFSTPNWQSAGGLYSAMPRDSLLVIGDTIIEAPMAWRCRYFESDAYRHLLKDYFRRGAKWLSAPKPQLLDALYEVDYDHENPQISSKYVINEFEPTFDAADFIRCGRDIFVQYSHVTNKMGVEWVRRHIGSEYTVHAIPVTDSAPMHIDATFMPLAPGKLLLNGQRIIEVPKLFRDWEIRFAPPPALPASHQLYMSSAWISMNVLMINPQCVVVERHETALIKMLESWGFGVIPLKFQNVMRFGGAFHCVTCDIRRRGQLVSYF